MTLTPQFFADHPWRSINQEELELAETVPTMLTQDEAQLYYWLAREVPKGPGAIVDLGCFVGGSTARMAAGALASQSGAQIHAFDRFTASKALKTDFLYPAGVAEFHGQDLFWTAQSLLRPFVPNVHLRRGDITKQTWSGGQIDLMTLDASKSITAMDKMSKTFFPSLRAGKSVIVQQDFIRVLQPWIAVQMELWADHFVPVAMARHSSVVYLCTQTPTTKAVKKRRVAALSQSERLAHLEAARDKLSVFGDYVVQTMTEALDALSANPAAENVADLRKTVD